MTRYLLSCRPALMLTVLMLLSGLPGCVPPSAAPTTIYTLA